MQPGGHCFAVNPDARLGLAQQVHPANQVLRINRAAHDRGFEGCGPQADFSKRRGYQRRRNVVIPQQMAFECVGLVRIAGKVRRILKRVTSGQHGNRDALQTDCVKRHKRLLCLAPPVFSSAPRMVCRDTRQSSHGARAWLASAARLRREDRGRHSRAEVEARPPFASAPASGGCRTRFFRHALR